jgi:hypothetical protein
MGEEEFEEFQDEDSAIEEEPEQKPVAKKPVGRPAKYEAPRETPAPAPRAQPVQPQPQYVAVPRAISVEAMLNELYDGQQEMRQALMAILEKLK